MKKSLEIGLVCAFSALCGFIVMLGLTRTWYSLIIGTITAGAIGYFAVDFHQVRAAIRHAVSQIKFTRKTKEDRKLWRKMTLHVLLEACNLIPLYAFMYFILLNSFTVEEGVASYLSKNIVPLVLIFLYSALFVYLIINQTDLLFEEAKDGKSNKYLNKVKNNSFLNVWFVRIPIWFFRTACATPRIIKNTMIATRNIIIRIHSMRRVTCMLYASLGAVTSFIIWQPIPIAALTGMTAGALLGQLAWWAATTFSPQHTRTQ